MIAKLTPYRHSDKTTNISLYYLRAQIIRDGSPGLEHVDALLRLRGLDPAAMHVPTKSVVRFRSGEFQRAVLVQLWGGPKTVQEIADTFADRLAHVDNWNRKMRVRKCLRMFEGRGVVLREGLSWSAASSPKNHKFPLD